MELISEKVKKRLSDLDKTQTDLAKYVGVSWNGLAKMLNRGTFKTDHMMKISKFLEVDLNFFGLNTKSDSDNNIVNESEDADFTKVDMLKQALDAKDEVIHAKDEVIRSKDELIATLKQKLKE